MYQDIFDDQEQTAMRHFFLDYLATLGTVRKFAKNEIVDFPSYKAGLGIVTKGKVVKSIVSSQGRERILYTLRPGEIMGEMHLFSVGAIHYNIRVKEPAEISFVAQEALLKVIQNDRAVYHHLIHSIIRKFRIVLLQLTNTTFNDSLGRVADALMRLAACADTLEGTPSGMISTAFTQTELAQNVGCSRITITRALSKFVKEDVIRIKDRKILIKDIDALASFTDRCM